MANVLVDESSLTNIANAIREKNGTTTTYKPSEMASAISSIETEPTLQSKIVTPSTSSQTITADSSYDGLSKVTVNAVTSSIDSDIKASNIKSGVNILGVTGTLEEGITPSGTLEITENGTHDVTNYASANVNVESDVEVYTPEHISFYLFEGTSLENALKNLDTSNVTVTEKMFYSCGNLTSVDLSSCVFRNIKSARQMFYNDYALTSVKNLNLSLDEDSAYQNSIDYMFYGCTNLTSVDLSITTSRANTLSNMFFNCIALTSLDLSKIIAPSVKYLSKAFYNCKKLSLLDLSSIDFSIVTSYTDMLYNVPTTCQILVKDETAKNFFTTNFSTYTNVVIKS